MTGVALVGTGGDTMVDDVDGAAGAVAYVEGGIMIPLLADDADGATVNGGVLAEDTNGVSVDVDADGATVDGRVSVEDTNGVSVDEGSALLANDARCRRCNRRW